MAIENAPKEELVSLDALLPEAGKNAIVEAAGTVSASVSSTMPSTTASGAPVATSPESPPESQLRTMISIDDLLAVEDPQFAQSMAELKKQGAEVASAAVEIDSLDIQSLALELPKNRWRRILIAIRTKAQKIREGATWIRISELPKALGPAVKRLALATLSNVKHGATIAVNKTSKTAYAFRALPGRSKATLLAAIGLGICSIVTLKLTLGGKITLGHGNGFLSSFEAVADAKFIYNESEPLEEFTDPLFHPEHVVAMEKIVINLRGSAETDQPMGLFAFYFEASNQETAVELKDRESEARDVVSRVLEQMSYQDLITAVGKERMKTGIRKSLNSFLTRGQVRRVFLKNIVLKN